MRKHKRNPEAARRHTKTWELKNPDKLNAKWRKPETRAAIKKWMAQNPEKMRDYRMRFNHGITLAEYNSMFQEQNGLCKICQKHDDKLHIDHCHKSNVIRGLLCGKCNRGLGMYDDSPELLEAAAAYLRKLSTSQSS